MDNKKKLIVLPLVMLSLVACSQNGESSSSASPTPESSTLLGQLRASQGRQTLPSLGEAPILVVPVDFKGDGLAGSKIRNDANVVFFGSSAPNCPSVREFYATSSYGATSITGEVAPVVELENDYLTYLQAVASSGTSSVVSDIADYAVNYLFSETGGYSLSDYDKNGDGKVDSLFILYARDTYDSDYSTQGAALFLETASIRLSEPSSYINNVSWMNGNSPYSSSRFIREVAYHMGVENYADSTGNYSGNYRMPLGYTDVMDCGLYDHNPFTKWSLGYLEPTIITPENVGEHSSITLRSAYNHPDAVVLSPEETGLFGEYLIIDYFTPFSREASEATSTIDPLTSSGIRVYKVDARLAKNAGGQYVPYEGEPVYDGSVYDFAYTNNGIGDYSAYGFVNDFPLIGLLMKSANNRHFTSSTTMVTSSELFQEGDSFSDETGIPGFYDEYRLDGDGVEGPLLGLTFKVESINESGATLSFSKTEVTQ